MVAGMEGVAVAEHGWREWRVNWRLIVEPCAAFARSGGAGGYDFAPIPAVQRSTMNAKIDALKKQFREGRRAEAIAQCEALCSQKHATVALKRLCAMMHLMERDFARAREWLLQVRASGSGTADDLFNIGLCERELKDFTKAAETFGLYTDRFPADSSGWAGLAESQLGLREFDAALRAADRAIGMDPVCISAWTARANAQQATGRREEALTSFAHAIQLAPNDVDLKLGRGGACEAAGNWEQAVADYKAVLAARPNDGVTLKNACNCLLRLDRGSEAVDLCRDILKTHPDSLDAKLCEEWLLNQLVPGWHIPMMNEEERNLAYYEGLKAVVAPDKTVFEIGTGSGLLAMMAARLGARKVVTCEAVDLIARTAREIVRRNDCQGQVSVLAKPSYQVQLGTDLPEKADVLVHEIFASDLLGEHVLPSLEDAKARLLKEGGEVLPARGSIMIALVSGDALGTSLHVDKAFGFDLSPFNANSAKRRPISRDDFPRVLLSADVEAFRFDFMAQSQFPPEKKRIDIPVVKSGLCYGVIQWIRFEFDRGVVVFENHPTRCKPVANWQHVVYLFDAPAQLEAGEVVTIDAMHGRASPWFERVR
jgi:tetratricopeptide (TPR) repeat protein